MLSRRDVVGKLAAGTAAVCVAGVAAANAATKATRVGRSEGRVDLSPTEPAADAAVSAADLQIVDGAPPATLSAPAPWELLRPLAMGSVVAPGWRLAGLTGVVDGSCVLTLENEQGRTQRVHLCRNHGGAQGLVYTKRFDLVVMNGGQGSLPTDEGFAQAVAAVAHVLAANEGESQHEPVVTALLPHAERVERFASSAKLR